jgi:hypothetical protein
MGTEKEYRVIKRSTSLEVQRDKYIGDGMERKGKGDRTFDANTITSMLDQELLEGGCDWFV